MTVAMKRRMNALMGNPTLTKHTPVHFPSETLDTVSLLVHAAEVISTYGTNARKIGSENKRKAWRETTAYHHESTVCTSVRPYLGYSKAQMYLLQNWNLWR